MRDIFPRRLRQARKMRGYSLRGLADATQGTVSHNAIARYERGDMLPGSPALLALADALNQPVDYFFRPYSLELSGVRFRKKSTLSESKREALKSDALDFFERYREVEMILDEMKVYTPPFKKESVQDVTSVSKMADTLRIKWNLGQDPLPNIHETMESQGIKVYEAKTNNDEFDGFSAKTQEGPVVVIAAWLNENLPRKRLTEVHELGHIVLPLPNDLPEKKEEALVMSFSGSFLMPRERFIDVFGQNRHNISLGELIELKSYFGASIMAIMYRAQNLGLISMELAKRFWQYAAKHQWRIEGEPGDNCYKGNEGNGRFRQLVHRAVVEEKISASKGAALLRVSISELRNELKHTFT